MPQKRPVNGLEYLLDEAPDPTAEGNGADGVAKSLPAHFVEIEDARRHSRLPQAEFDVTFERGIEPVPAKGSELSRGGMFVSTRHALPKGDIVSLRITLGERTIKVIAEVIWEREKDPTGALDVSAGMGLKFLDIDDADADFVEAFVAD